MHARRVMLEPQDGKLSLRRQCDLLRLSRSGIYYQSEPISDEDLIVMRLIDEEYLRHPFYGSRRMAFWLGTKSHPSNRKRVQRLMRVMGLEGIAPGPRTSRAEPEHPKYPYLLRNLAITEANHVWAADITYIPMVRGFVYLVAILDWYSRRVLAWRVSKW